MPMSNRGSLKVLGLVAFLALSLASTAMADCLPTNAVAFLDVGFDFFAGGPYAEFAISHDWLNGTSLVTLGTGQLCQLAPQHGGRYATLQSRRTSSGSRWQIRDLAYS